MMRKESMNNQILLQEYRVIELICDHQDTIVYLTQHVMLQGNFILKQISKNSAAYYQALSEAALLRSFQHPYIPKLFATYEEDGYYYLVEEYVEGESLHSICQTEQLSLKTILSYSIQLCDLISYLHSLSEPVLHLDINPHNIIIKNHHLYLIDFGAAIHVVKGNYRASRYGTIGYAAPEQFNQKRLDVRTDIYAIGSTMDFMLTIQDIASYPLEVMKSVKNLEVIIRRCKKERKTQRYSRVQQVGSLLSKLYQKEAKPQEEKELSISVAGAQTHIGTTHVSLLLCSWLQKNKIPCIYVECNSTNAVKQLWNKSNYNSELGLYEYNGIPILPHGLDSNLNLDKWYKNMVTVLDYGALTRENLEIFQEGNLKLLVHGSKPYEMEPYQQCLSMITRYDQTYFLNNFQTAGVLSEKEGVIPKGHRFRMPYVELNCVDQLGKLDTLFDSLLFHLYK